MPLRDPSAWQAQLVERLADLADRPQAREYMVDVAREAVWEGVDRDRVCQIAELDPAELDSARSLRAHTRPH